MKTSWWICPKSFSLSVPKAALAWMLLNNYFCGECFFFIRKEQYYPVAYIVKALGNLKL